MRRTLANSATLTLIGCCAYLNIAVAAPTRAADYAAQLESFTNSEGTSFFALSLPPPSQLPTSGSAAEVVIAFDTSASQAGPFREKGLQVLNGLLATLGEDDRVQIIAYDLRPIPLTKQFVAPRSQEATAAVERLRMRVPLGAADLAAAISAADECFSKSRVTNRAVVFIGDGRSNANMAGVDDVHLIDQLVNDHVAIHSFAVGPVQNRAELAALGNQTGGVVAFDGDTIAGPEAGQQLTRAIHEPIIWPHGRNLPATFLEVYPVHMPPMRSDRDTVLIGRGTVNGEFTVIVNGDIAGGPVEFKWAGKSAMPDDGNAFLAQLVEAAKRDGGYSLPTIGSEGLFEARRVLNLAAHNIAELGRQAASSGNINQANQFINEAMRRDPDNLTALVVKRSLLKGKTQLASLEVPAAGDTKPTSKYAEPPPEPQAGDLLRSVEQMQHVIQQQVLTESTVVMNRARDRMANDPGAVIDELKRLLDRVLRVPELTGEQRADLRNRIASLFEQATRRQSEKEAADVERQQNLATTRDRQRALDGLQRKETQLDGLIERFNALVDLGYQHSDEVNNDYLRDARSAAADEFRPAGANPYGHEPVATTTAPNFASLVAYQAENMAVRDAAERNFMEEMHLVDVSHIPSPDSPPIVYPDVGFWRKITAGRKKWAGVDLASTSPSEQKILQSLDDKATLDSPDMPLKDAIDYLSDKHHIPITFDNNALKDAAIDPTAIQVGIPIKDISLRSALKLILGQYNLTYNVKNEVLQITTMDKAKDQLVTKVYPVADLVLPVQAPMADPSILGGGMMGGGMGGGMMGGGMMGGGMMGGGFGGGMMGGGMMGGGMFGGGGF